MTLRPLNRIARSLASVACATKKLKVLRGIFAAPRERNDVINLHGPTYVTVLARKASEVAKQSGVPRLFAANDLHGWGSVSREGVS